MSDSEVWRQYEEQNSAKGGKAGGNGHGHGHGDDHGHGHGHGGNVPEPAAYGVIFVGMCVILALALRRWSRGDFRRK